METKTKENKKKKEQQVIIAMGSNYGQIKNIDYAKNTLLRIFANKCCFSHSVWSEPIGMESDQFMNCLCYATTSHAYSQIERALKQIEKRCERSTKNNSLGRITLDLDILQYGDTRLREDDWQRPYIQDLINSYTPTI